MWTISALTDKMSPQGRVSLSSQCLEDPACAVSRGQPLLDLTPLSPWSLLMCRFGVSCLHPSPSHHHRVTVFLHTATNLSLPLPRAMPCPSLPSPLCTSAGSSCRGGLCPAPEPSMLPASSAVCLARFSWWLHTRLALLKHLLPR